jgi:hypothetical protein
MDIKWPDSVPIEATAIIMPSATLLKMGNDLTLAQMDRDLAQAEVLTANELVTALRAQVTRLTEQDQAKAKRIEDLEQALAEATKPPVIPPPSIPHPIPRAPVISKTEARDLVGLTIENGDDDPDPEQYTLIRKVLTRAAGIFNTARWFMNAFEVAKHATLDTTDRNHLPGFAKGLGITYVADTVDSEVWRVMQIEVDPKKTPQEKARATAGLKAYLQGLETLAAAFVINDANQYREAKTPDGTPKYPRGTLERIVERIRAITPNTPLIASLTATAHISEYPMFDLYEAQTFGSQSELAGFLTRAFDIFCLDARDTMTAEGLRVRGQVILTTKPRAIFYYTDQAGDWLSMPNDKLETIKGIVAQLKTAR